jgi:hypothetical protein
MSDTPVTDKNKRQIDGFADEWVPRYVCEELERKLTDMQKKHDEMRYQNIMLDSMCQAAGAEIKSQFEAHCNEEGYGPCNLLYRLIGKTPADIYPYYVEQEDLEWWYEYRDQRIYFTKVRQ